MVHHRPRGDCGRGTYLGALYEGNRDESGSSRAQLTETDEVPPFSFEVEASVPLEVQGPTLSRRTVGVVPEVGGEMGTGYPGSRRPFLGSPGRQVVHGVLETLTASIVHEEHPTVSNPIS